MQIPDGTEPIYKVPLRHQSKIVDRPIGTIAKIKRCQYSIP
ncbi:MULTISPECIES: hypothetical protein [unclassified Microcoleus]